MGANIPNGRPGPASAAGHSCGRTLLRGLIRHLGSELDFSVTDTAGNKEYMVFIYDFNRVQSRNIVGEGWSQSALRGRPWVVV